jgi:phage tail-like protein
MATRDTPFPAFNFVVELGDGVDSNSALGGFSDVTGLGTENTLMDYRQGNDKENRVRKVPGLYKASDVTCKRGIMGLTTFWDWVKATRTSPFTQRNVQVTLHDEQGQPDWCGSP